MPPESETDSFPVSRPAWQQFFGSRSGKTLVICLGLLAMTGLAYWQMPNLEFVFFDDPGYVLDNLHVHKGLVKENFWWALYNTGEQSNWHPLTWWSHMLDIELFGFKAVKEPASRGPHVVNLIFHLGNTLLLFFCCAG